MTKGPQPANASRLLRRMTRRETEALRNDMGLDLVNWAVDERGAKRLESQLAVFRKALSSAKESHAFNPPDAVERCLSCASCESPVRDSETYVTLVDSTTVCATCLHHFLGQLRRGIP
jgi:hypothetical protein